MRDLQGDADCDKAEAEGSTLGLEVSEGGSVFLGKSKMRNDGK